MKVMEKIGVTNLDLAMVNSPDYVPRRKGNARVATYRRLVEKLKSAEAAVRVPRRPRGHPIARKD
jgi:hypothetical protein